MKRAFAVALLLASPVSALAEGPCRASAPGNPGKHPVATADMIPAKTGVILHAEGPGLPPEGPGLPPTVPTGPPQVPGGNIAG
jgi:hypothetical protein